MSSKNTQSHERASNFLLWLGILGPPTLWLTYLLVAYVLIHHASEKAKPMPLHLVSLGFIILSLAHGVMAWSQWRGVRYSSIDLDEGPVPRTKMMSFIGMLSSIEFALIIGGSWVAMFLLHPSQS